MGQGSKEAIEVLAAIIKELNLKVQLEEIAYRVDYQDYQVNFENTHHCEIREKLIDDYLRLTGEPQADAKREIVYIVSHLVAWEDWEQPDKSSGSSPDDRMEIDKEI